jgi:hypothetical protein
MGAVKEALVAEQRVGLYAAYSIEQRNKNSDESLTTGE